MYQNNAESFTYIISFNFHNNLIKEAHLFSHFTDEKNEALERLLVRKE